MNKNTETIISLYDGERTSTEIAKTVGLSPRYVRKVAYKYGLDRLGVGARFHNLNHQFVSGRRIDLDGYVLVTAPLTHPFARLRKNRLGKIIYEHRLVLEKKLGRYLLPSEVVDHIDGLTLHNCPTNLRIFSKNGEHLRETRTGFSQSISVSGLKNIKARNRLAGDFVPVDIYRLRRKRGDVRLRQIFLAVLKLGIDSPYLLGTHLHLKKIQISDYSHPMIKHALDKLYQRWEQDLAR